MGAPGTSPVPPSDDPARPVSRCICRDLPFTDLKQIATTEHLNFEQLRARTGCSATCRLCEPYVRLMLLTGETRFRVLTQTEMDALMRQ
jgi:bacterioferritin-associated ferredoxin